MILSWLLWGILLCLKGDHISGASVNSVTIYVDPKPNSIANESCWKAGPCANLDLGLQGLKTISQSSNTTNVILSITPGFYFLMESIKFTNVSHIAMVAAKNGTVQIDCNIFSTPAGLSFVRVQNVLIQGISFWYCGALQSSTSYNFNSNNPDYLKLYVSLYFLYCRDVTLSNITVAHTPGTGVVFYNTVGYNLIEHSYFINNSFNRSEEFEEFASGGGVYVEFSYCEPGRIDCLSEHSNETTDLNFTHGARYNFVSSNFNNNTATVVNKDSDTFILPNKHNHIALGRGGGLSVYFKGKATNNSITVANCSFLGNIALWGGGIFIEYQDNAYRNNFTLAHSWLLDNSLFYKPDSVSSGTGGGGISAGYLFFGEANEVFDCHIFLTDCHIESNHGYFGGGVSFYSANQMHSSYAMNTFKMEKCTVYGNVGRLGSGMDISLWHASKSGIPVAPEITNCTFRQNTANYYTEQYMLVGIGSVYIDTLPVKFAGDNYFEGNDGSALVLLASDTTIQPNTAMHFENNTGRNGGAVAFLGQSRMVVSENTNFTFINNSAQYYGGALYSYNAGEHDLLASRNCFIQYYNIESEPANWTSNFYFKSNKADGKPNSIYSTTLIQCLWGSPKGAVDVNTADGFCWQSWHYIQSKCSEQVDSGAVFFNVKHEFDIIPGNATQLGAHSYNIKNQTKTDTIYIARVVNGSASFRGNNSLNYTYISHGVLDIKGKPGTNATLEVTTMDPKVIRTLVNIKFSDCPPGFISDDSNECQCRFLESNYFDGNVKCDSYTFTSQILREAWMGTIKLENESVQVVGIYPYPSINYSGKDFLSLPTDSRQLNDFFCNSTNRKGTLCGSCKNGYGPSVTSIECIKCSSSGGKLNWLYYLVVIFLPITIFFGFIMFFGMSITFGPLNGYIFFAQITSALKAYSDSMILYSNPGAKEIIKTFCDIHNVVYGIWNLDFFLPWIPPFCLMANMNTLTLISLQYLPALYPLLLLAFVWIVMTIYNRGVRVCVVVMKPLHYCLARLRGKLNLELSFTGGIATFLLISYTKMLSTSFALLNNVQLYNERGHANSSRMYWNGDIVMGSSDSWPYITVALMFFFTFGVLPPILLVMPSILLALAKALKWECLRTLQPVGKLQEFLDVFHGCYKDGTSSGSHDCRWFAGLYFFLRIVPFLIAALTTSRFTISVLQIMFLIVTAFLFASIRPYKQNWINNVDTSMFLIMAGISALFLHNLAEVRTEAKERQWTYILMFILIFLPLVYCTVCFLWLFCRTRIRKLNLKRSKCVKHQQRIINNPVRVTRSVVSVEEDSRSPLIDSTGIENFLEFTRGNRRMEGDANKSINHVHIIEGISEEDPLMSEASSSESMSTGRQLGTVALYGALP